MKLKKNSKDHEISYRSSFQMGFNPFLKDRSTRVKTAIYYSKSKLPVLVDGGLENHVSLVEERFAIEHPVNEQFDNSETKNGSWEIDEINVFCDTYDKETHNREAG